MGARGSWDEIAWAGLGWDSTIESGIGHRAKHVKRTRRKAERVSNNEREETANE